MRRISSELLMDHYLPQGVYVNEEPIRSYDVLMRSFQNLDLWTLRNLENIGGFFPGGVGGMGSALRKYLDTDHWLYDSPSVARTFS